MLNDIEISRSKIHVKVKLVKVLEKYPKLKKSSLSLNFMKNYMKSTKKVCKKKVMNWNGFNDVEIC